MKQTPLKRKSRIKRKKRLNQINKARQAKKRAKYKSYLSSRVWKEKRQAALLRAGFRCECRTDHLQLPEDILAPRCLRTTRLTVHHLTYARFGGKELPEDLQVLCWSCHKKVHANETWKNRRAS